MRRIKRPMDSRLRGNDRRRKAESRRTARTTSPYLKRLEHFLWRLMRLDGHDARRARPAPEPTLKSLERFALAASERFDISVRNVPNPTRQAEALGLIERRGTKSDALDAAGNFEASAHGHD